MDTLKIQFSYMMLFLRTDAGMDVLLPEALHRATLVQTGVDMIRLTPGSRVWVTETGGQPLTGRVAVDRYDRASRANEVIVSVRNLLKEFGHQPTYVRRDCLRTAKVPNTLNARVELNGGKLEAASCLCPDDAEYATAKWVFSNGYWDRPLTDRAIYTLPLAGRTLEVHADVPDQGRRTFLTTHGTHFEIANGDLPGSKTNFVNAITELQAIYDLYDPALAVGYPVLHSHSLPAWVQKRLPARPFSPEVPMCPPMDDCEESGTCD